MGDKKLLLSVGQARQRLDALRKRLENEDHSPGAPQIASDLGELQEALAAIQARFVLLREILDRTTDSVFAKDLDGRYVMMNVWGAQMLGKSVVEVLGEDDWNLFSHDDAQRITAIDREVMRLGKPQTSEEKIDLNGVPTILITTRSAWYDESSQLRGVIGTSHDVTERRQSESEVAVHQDRLRSMATGIVMAEERLRRSLAADLHNGLGQDIALARMRLSLLRQSASVDLHAPLTVIEQLLEQADGSVRSIAFQISPPVLHDLGLLPALEWLADDMGTRHELVVRIEDVSSPKVLDDRVRVLLFRAVREILIAAVSLDRKKETVVRLSSVDGELRVTIVQGKCALGGEGEQENMLFSVREQLRDIDATVEISVPNDLGSRVILTVPLTNVLPVTAP